MSDAIALPLRPRVDDYEQLSADLQHLCNSGEPGAVRDWAMRWMERDEGHFDGSLSRQGM